MAANIVRYSISSKLNPDCQTRKHIMLAVSVVLSALTLVACQPSPTEQKIPKGLHAISHDALPAKPVFSEIQDVNQKKEAFFGFMAPRVERVNEKIIQIRTWLQSLEKKLETQPNISEAEQAQLLTFAERYRVTKDLPNKQIIEELLIKIDVIPVSMALAQAANESAWGTSRFATQANNFFGQWCYEPGCGLIPRERPEDQIHEVADFDNALDSVISYVQNINRHYTYEELRELRVELRNADQPITGLKLIPTLTQYSERREAYVEELRDMIEYNELHLFDQNEEVMEP